MRRYGVSSSINRLVRASIQIQRAAERQRIAQQREAERQVRLNLQEQRRIVKEQERLERLSVKEQKEFEKQQKALYLESRKTEVQSLNNEVKLTLEEFESILSHALSSDTQVQFESLYKNEAFPDFIPPDLEPILDNPEPIRESFFAAIPSPSLAEKLFGLGKKARNEMIANAESAYQTAYKEYEKQKQINYSIEKMNEQTLLAAREEYVKQEEMFKNEVKLHNEQIDQFRDRYFQGEQDAVESYNTIVLDRTQYSELFPQHFELVYNSDTKELAVQYELSVLDIVPEFKEYKYVQSRDEIKGTAFKPKEISEIYSSLIASVTLRTMYELFTADQANAIESVVFNGIVNTVDPGTGQDIHPCIITIQALKSEFLKFDLNRVDVITCVKGLKAHISPSIIDLAPVKPIVNFDMIDRRFINEKDMLSDLDDRTNLLEMDPFDFEHLICNLFGKIGLESKLTRSSRDGGIDVVAFDPRPVFGGKYVIQAKRYKNTVDVAAVRDLYGSMMNENASKGILVTTSSYGPDARSFAKDKPIELIDGSSLLYMLEEQGIKAKIVMPQ